MDTAKRIIDKLSNANVITSTHSAISLICLAFANYMQVDVGVSDLKYEQVKKKVQNIIVNEQLSAAFTALSRYVINDDLLTELVKYIVNARFSQQEWAAFIELVANDIFASQHEREVESPAPLNMLCCTLLKPCNGSFYDGVAGIGSTAICAYNYSKKMNAKLSVFCQETNELFYSLSVIRAFLNGIDFSNMRCGDTLTNPMFLDNTSVQKFDFSIMFPPFGLSWKSIDEAIRCDRHNRFSMGLPQTSSSDWLFVQHFCASIKEGGRGIIAIPAGALYHSSTNKIRNELVRSGILECIITLPTGMFKNTGVPICLLVIHKAKQSAPQILMIDAEKLFEKEKPVRWKNTLNLSPDIIEQLDDMYQNRTEKDGISVVVSTEEIANNDNVLIPLRYMNALKVTSEFGTLVIKTPTDSRWKGLNETGTIYRGINPTSLIQDDNGPYRLINYADVQNGVIALSELSRYSTIVNGISSNYIVKTDDILIACKGSALKLCMVPKHDSPVLLSVNFARLEVDKARFNPKYIYYYLTSPVGQSMLKNKQVGSTTIFTLSLRDIESILIPYIPLERQERYASELSSRECEIEAKQTELVRESKEARWSFYEKIGITDVMKKGE